MTRPIVVIGGGIVGSAIAYELQTHRFPTVLIERDLTPQGASASSFASLTAFDEALRDVYLLRDRGMVGWRRWGKELGDELGIAFGGEIRWAGSKAAASSLVTAAERAIARGYPTRYVNRAEVMRREPSLHPADLVVATLAPYDGQVDPLKAISALRKRFVAGGGEVMLGRAALVVEEDQVAVRVGEERIAARTVVIAAGAETNALLERLGWDVPMEASPGLLAFTRPMPPVLTGTVYVYPEREMAVHMRQLPDGRIAIGERSQEQVAREPTMEHARRLLHEARRHLPALASTDIERFTVEWRPMPRDHMPIVGYLPGLPSVYLATGHSGVTIAPALAAAVTQEVGLRKEVEQMGAFRPGRFAADQAEAFRNIEEAFAPSEVFLG